MPHPFVGSHTTIAQIREHIGTWAQSTDPLLIIGEPGVGKTLLAEHIHEASSLRQFRIVIFDVSTMTDRIQRLELCGAEPPENSTTRRSALEFSTTVVLRHVDRARAYIQEKLAESLRTGQVMRFSASKVRPMKARAIMTLSMQPEELLNAPGIQRDLYRVMLDCQLVHIPPLRERLEDVPLLVDELYRREKATSPSEEETIQIVEAIKKQDFKGNVAGIVDHIRRIFTRTPDGKAESLDSSLVQHLHDMLKRGEPISLRQQLDVIEMSLVQDALKRTGGNQIEAAKLLGVTDRTIRRLIERKEQQS